MKTAIGLGGPSILPAEGIYPHNPMLIFYESCSRKNGRFQTRSRLIALPRDNAEGWKQHYIAIRRELQTAFAAFNKAVDAWQPAGADGSEAYQLRMLVAAFRSRLAEHQARFPAVTIDPADAAYWASMKRTDAALGEIATFVRALDRR